MGVCGENESDEDWRKDGLKTRTSDAETERERDRETESVCVS